VLKEDYRYKGAKKPSESYRIVTESLSVLTDDQTADMFLTALDKTVQKHVNFAIIATPKHTEQLLDTSVCCQFRLRKASSNMIC